MSRRWTAELTCPSCYRNLVIIRETIWKKYLWKIRFCCYCGKALDAEVSADEIEEEPK